MLTVRIPVMWVGVAVIGRSFAVGVTAVRRAWSRRVSVHERVRGGEFLAGLEPGLQAGKDHRPPAVQVTLCVLAQLVGRDGDPPARAHGLDFPRNPPGASSAGV